MAAQPSAKSPERPVIGLTTYRKTTAQTPPIVVYGLMPSYVEAVVAAGGVPLLIPLGLSQADLAVIISRVDGLLLPGGGDVDPAFYPSTNHVELRGLDRQRDQTELMVARAGVERNKPLLAICRGIQVLNVALGGSLWGDIASQVPDAIDHDFDDPYPRNHRPHAVEIEADSALARQMGRTRAPVNSMHHQAVRDLAAGLVVNAIAPDGIIEGVEVPGHPFAIGVQWHPENLIDDDPSMLALFRGLVEAAAAPKRNA